MKKVKKYIRRREEQKIPGTHPRGNEEETQEEKRNEKTHPVLCSVEPLRPHREISDYLEDLIIFVISKVSPAVE